MNQEKFKGKINTTYFKENGYWLYKKPVFSTTQFQRIKTIFEELNATKDNIENTKGKAVGRHDLDTPHFYRPELLDFLLSKEALDLVEPLIGPNIGLWSSHFISKVPYVGKATPWHEDSAYWKGRFDRMDGIVTIWLAIDHSDAQNGAMQVIPGTHRNGFSEYVEADQNKHIFGSQIKEVDRSKAVVFELAPNECSLHDARIIHGAEANTSNRRRCGYTMRYFSQKMKLNKEHPMNQGFRIWHARGKNIHNNPVEN